MFLAATGLTTHIMNNQLKSVLLLLGFPVLLMLMIGTFTGSLQMLSDGYEQPYAQNFTGTDPAYMPHQPTGHLSWAAFKAGALSGIADYGYLAVLGAFIWFVIAYFFHGKMMRMATGSQPITREQMPRIYNLLENLCISRGLAMPKFEIIDSPAMNAFATGIDEKSYKIVLTRGIIDRLTDDELEAVIAHELSHIMNRDVRLLIISVIFVGMISFFAEMLFRILIHGRRPNYYRRSNDREGNGALVVMLLALAILAVGYVLAIMIRFALSRKREYLADAGAVELTKKPEAMMSALLRISGNDAVAAMPDEVQQMCIENSHNFMGIFATHPSISDRVRVLSEMTETPVPDQQVSLRRGPRKPWDATAAS